MENEQAFKVIGLRCSNALISDRTTHDLIDSLGAGGLAVQKTGEHLLVRMIGSAACTGYLQEVGSVARGS